MKRGHVCRTKSWSWKLIAFSPSFYRAKNFFIGTHRFRWREGFRDIGRRRHVVNKNTMEESKGVIWKEIKLDKMSQPFNDFLCEPLFSPTEGEKPSVVNVELSQRVFVESNWSSGVYRLSAIHAPSYWLFSRAFPRCSNCLK